MADVNATFNYDANFGSALSQIKALSKELSVLNNSFNSLDKNARVLRNDIANTFSSAAGQIGGFSSRTVTITSDLDNFGKSLDRSKLKLRDYYREASRAFSANSNARKLAEDQIRRTKGQLVELGMDAEGRRKGMLITPMRLDMTDMNNQLQVARKQFDIFNRLIQDGATSLINWGKNTQWAGRQLTVGLTVPMTIFASTTIKAFNDVDKELTRFQKVYGADLVGTTKEASMEMRNAIQAVAIDIAKNYGIAAKETAGLAADLAATGLEGKKLVDSVKETSRLAVLGELDRQDAMQTTLSLQNAFNMSTKELAESIDFLNAVENQTSVSLQDLTTAIPKVGPVMESLGGDVKDLAVLLVAMKEGGINAAESANALKSGLASLINPTKSASAIAKQYGIDLQGIVTRNKGQLMPTLLEFQSSLQTLDDFGKAKIIEQLFGKYQFARISALFDNLNAQGSQTVEVMKLMGASSEDLAKIADSEIKTLTESTSMRFQRSMESIKAALLPVGETLTRSVIPFMEKFANFMERVVEIGKGLPEPVKNFLKFATGLTAIAGPVVMITGVLANFLGYVTKGAMGFVNLGRKLSGLPTKQFSLLDDEQIAAAKATDILTVSIQNQATAMNRLVQLMRDYNSTLIAQRSATPGAFSSTPLITNPRRGGVPPRGTPIRRQQGSWVPGSGSGDKVKALLEPGEFVVNRNAAKQYGGVLEDMNNGTPRFKNGGRIKGYDDGGTFDRVSGPGAFEINTTTRQSQNTSSSSNVANSHSWGLNLESTRSRMSPSGLDLSHIATGKDVADQLRLLGVSVPSGSQVVTEGYHGSSVFGPAFLNRLLGSTIIKSSERGGNAFTEDAIRTITSNYGGFEEGSEFRRVLESGLPTTQREAEIFRTAISGLKNQGVNARNALLELEYFTGGGRSDSEIRENSRRLMIQGIPTNSPYRDQLTNIINNSPDGPSLRSSLASFTANEIVSGRLRGFALPAGSSSNVGTTGLKRLVQKTSRAQSTSSRILPYLIRRQSGGIAEMNLGGKFRYIKGLNEEPFIGPLPPVYYTNRGGYRPGVMPPEHTYPFKTRQEADDFGMSMGRDYIRASRKGVTTEQFADKDQEIMTRWIAGQTQSFRKNKSTVLRGAYQFPDDAESRERLKALMGKLRSRTLTRSTAIDVTKALEEFAPGSRNLVRKVLKSVQEGKIDESVFGPKLQFDDFASFSSESKASRYRKFVDPKMSESDVKKLESHKAKIEEGLLRAVMFKLDSAKQSGLEISERAIIQEFMGKPVSELETLLFRPKGQVESLSSNLETKMLEINMKQNGGAIQSPFVPGRGEGDRIPALLEPGEFVVNKKAAMKYGGLLHDINFNKAPRFQEGGDSNQIRQSSGMSGMGGMKTGAVSGAAMAIGMVTSMAGLPPAINNVIMGFSALTGVMSAFQMIMMKNNATGAAGGAGNLLQRGAAKRAGAAAAISGRAPMAAASGTARAGQIAGGLGRFAMGALMSGPGLAIAAVVAGAAFAWSKYKKEVEEARKATEQAFSVGERTAQAYGYELTKLSDQLKQNAELTKQIGINSSSVTSSIIVDEEKKQAILEDNAEFIADLQEKETRISELRKSGVQYTTTLPVEPLSGVEAVTGQAVTENGQPVTQPIAPEIVSNTNESVNRSNQQITSQLLTKYATLRQKGVSAQDANEIIRVIAMDAGDETISALLDLKPTLEKMNSDNFNEVFKLAQEAQLEGLKNINTGATGGGEAFKEAITASMDVVSYAPPEDQLEALNNLITNMRGFNSDQLVLAAEALATAAAANYGTKSGIGQALQTLFTSGDVDKIELGAEIDTLLKSDALTANQLVEIQVAIAEDDVDKVKSIIDPIAKDKNIKINMTVEMQKDAQKRIEEINKEITAQQALFDSQMVANDNAVESENTRYENAQKAHEDFIKQKQKEIEAINKSADAYIKALQDEQRADSFAQQQRDTAVGGLKSLASGDVFGFVQSQQEMAGAAQQFGFESEIKAIDERRQAAVDAKQEEIEKQQELAAAEEETHKNNLKGIEAQRVEYIKTNGDIMKGLQGQQGALQQISTMSGTAYDGIVEGFATVDIEANKVGATTAAVNYLLAHPDATVEQAIAEGRKFMESKAQNPGENFTSVGGSYSNREKISSKSPKYASGGYISGAGGPKADLIPARLSNGEYVVQASAVDQYGVGMMNAINEQKFADGGLVLDPSTKSKISIAEKQWGESFNIVKGGYLKADKFSGSTHTGGGVFDAYYAGGSQLFPITAVEALRKAGFAAWNRDQFGANNKHIHAIEIGNPNLSKSAASQVAAYLRGEDGLGGKDTLPNDVSGAATTTVIPDEVAPNLDKIAIAMGTTAAIYNQVKNDGVSSLLGRKFGGSMTMNKPYMVGENGPEIVMPYGSGGKVVPVKYNVPAMANGGIINGSMASGSPQINVTVNGVNDPKQAADRAAQLINSEMNRRKFSRSIG